MPNTGRPSRDCHLCRQRRVKCDLGRPGCQRCVKYGADCPGYRDPFELVFRNVDVEAIKKPRKRMAKRDDGEAGFCASTAASGSASSSSTDSASAFVIPSTFTDLVPAANMADAVCLALPRSLSEHWTTHSVPILLNVYSTLNFLHNIYRTTPRDGPLVWAAHLFARTYVTNMRYSTSVHRGSETETRRELGKYLGRTLSSVGAALNSPQGAFRDDVLATIWILTNYELLVGSLSRTEPLNPWHLHTRGLHSILQARGSAQLYTSRGRMAFWPCYNVIQIHALINSTECPPESDEWLGIIRDTLFDSEAYMLHVALFINTCTHVQARVLDILRLRDFGAAEGEYRTLVSQLRAGEQEVDGFVGMGHDLNDDIDNYMRILYYAALVKGYYIMQLLADFLTHYAPGKIPLRELRADREHCVQRSRSAAQRILDSIPRMLGWLVGAKDKPPKALFDALKLVWPLTAVFTMASTLPEQKSEAEAALIFIGKEIGIRQALNSSRQPAGALEAQRPLGAIKSDRPCVVGDDAARLRTTSSR